MENGTQHRRPHVVVIGGGFAGLNAALGLGKSDVEVTILDRKNHHTFQPLLYQVALAALSPADISAPIRRAVRHKKNIQVLIGNVIGFDVQRRQIQLEGGDQVFYDYLVVAAGATHSYFGHDNWAELAPGLKTLEDATEIRRRVLLAFELAERETLLKTRTVLSTSSSSAEVPPALNLRARSRKFPSMCSAPT